MKYITKLKIAAVEQLCVSNEKSAAYTYQLIQDVCKIDEDAINTYVGFPPEDHKRLYKDVVSLCEVLSCLDNFEQTSEDVAFDQFEIQEAMVKAMLWGAKHGREMPDMRPDQLHEMFIINNHEVDILNSLGTDETEN